MDIIYFALKGCIKSRPSAIPPHVRRDKVKVRMFQPIMAVHSGVSPCGPMLWLGEDFSTHIDGRVANIDPCRSKHNLAIGTREAKLSSRRIQ
jgi:hypothetical protein